MTCAMALSAMGQFYSHPDIQSEVAEPDWERWGERMELSEDVMRSRERLDAAIEAAGQAIKATGEALSDAFDPVAREIAGALLEIKRQLTPLGEVFGSVRMITDDAARRVAALSPDLALEVSGELDKAIHRVDADGKVDIFGTANMFIDFSQSIRRA